MGWIRVEESLPTHRKSVELSDELGEPRAWARMVMLWTWAKENARDGEICGKNPARLVEVAVGWEGPKGRFVEAAVAVGFLEWNRARTALLIHDWDEHNGNALKKAESDTERVRKWRAARRETRIDTRNETSSERGNGTNGTNSTYVEETKEGGQEAPPAAEAAAPSKFERLPKPADLQALWNEFAPPAGLPTWSELSKGREAAARERLKERGLSDSPQKRGWRTVIARIAASSFCRGQNPRNWRADPDFLLQRDTAAKVLEGKYDDRKGTGPPGVGPKGFVGINQKTGTYPVELPPEEPT